MSWPAWPSFEFPPKELPVFLHPLRLIPYYRDRIGSALTSFLKRDDSRLFGPVEQSVTAIVVIGLALQSDQTAIHTDEAHVLPANPGGGSANDTSPSVIPHSPVHLSSLVSPARQTGSATFDLLLGLALWFKDQLSMSAVLVFLLGFNAGLMMLPAELKTRLQTSWDLFWPPWQDRSLIHNPRTISPASLTDKHDTRSFQHEQASGSRTSRDVPVTKEEQPVAKPPQAESTNVAGEAGKTITASRSSPKGKERMEGERPAERGSRTVDSGKIDENKNGDQPEDEQDEVRKQLDKVRARMLALKQDSTMDEPAKAVKLKELDKMKDKLKEKLTNSTSAKVPPSAKNPEKQQSESAKAHKTTTTTPDVDTAGQLVELKEKIEATRDDESLDETKKPSQLKKLEAMRQGLKTKSVVAPTESKGSLDEGSTTPKTPKVSMDQSAPAMSVEDQKQLERLKAKMIVVKADKTLSGSDRAARLSQLDKARQQLKQKAQASQDNPKKDEKLTTSSEPATPKTVATIAKRGADLSPEVQKQLEKLNGKMAAVKADETLTESERASKLRELDKARQILKVDQSQSSGAQVQIEVAKSPHALDPGLATPRSSQSATAKFSDTSDIDTSTSNDTARSSISDDPLLSGESRQLKSALKKSKKKPRQKKNIHHNYFMTMRGWRPALVPFPHGLHPKPQHPRHTLWWDNVPKDADHIMASPKIAKLPEGLRPGEDETGSEGKKEKGEDEKASSEEGKKVLEKVDKKIPPIPPEPSDKKRSAESSGADKRKVEQKASSRIPNDKKDEAAKLKAAAEAKEQAKDREEEAKAKAKASERSTTGKGASPMPSIPVPPPVDPQVQKATWVTQGMLCALIWFVHEQLALVLLTFFVWQHMQDSKTRVAALTVAPAQAIGKTERKLTTSVPKAESSLASSGVRKLSSEGERTKSGARSAPEEGVVQPLAAPAKASAGPKDPSDSTRDAARKAQIVPSKPDTSHQPLPGPPNTDNKTRRSPDSLVDAPAKHPAKMVDPDQSTKEVRSAAQSPATADNAKSRVSTRSGNESVTSSDRLQSRQGVDEENRTLPAAVKARGIDPKRKTPVSTLDDRRKDKPESPTHSASSEVPDARLSPNEGDRARQHETPAGAGTTASSNKEVRAQNPAVSKVPLTGISGAPESKRQNDLDARQGRQAEQPKPAPDDDSEIKAVVDRDSAFGTAESKNNGPTRHGTTGSSTTGKTEGVLTPDMIQKLEKIPLDKRDKYARMVLAEAHRPAEDRPRTNRRRIADTESGRSSTSQAALTKPTTSEQKTVDEDTTSEAEPNKRSPGREGRQARAETDDKVIPRATDARYKAQMTMNGPRGEDGPPLSLEAGEGDRRAAERAKAARREQRLREKYRQPGSGSPPAEEISSPDRKGASREIASPRSDSGRSRRRITTDMTAEVAKEHDRSLNEGVNNESERKPKAPAAPPSRLLVAVEEGADGTLESDVPIADLLEPAPDFEKIRRNETAKPKEARRAKLSAKIPPIQTPPRTEDYDHEADEKSPTSVYSQMTDAPSLKRSHRLTRDVAAAREALHEDAPAAGTHRRTSSISSLDVICFAGAEASRAMRLEGPRSAPIVPEVENHKGVDIEGASDRERTTPMRLERKNRDRAETSRKDDGAAANKLNDTRRREVPHAEVRDKGKTKSGSSSDVAHNAYHKEKVARSTKDEARREKRSRPAVKQSKIPRRESKHAGDDCMDASGKASRTDVANAVSKAARDHPTKTKPDRNLSLEDLTPEQVEKLQKAREKRKMEKARAAKEALGQGSSGLTVDEKASLPSP